MRIHSSSVAAFILSGRDPRLHRPAPTSSKASTPAAVATPPTSIASSSSSSPTDGTALLQQKWHDKDPQTWHAHWKQDGKTVTLIYEQPKDAPNPPPPFPIRSSSPSRAASSPPPSGTYELSASWPSGAHGLRRQSPQARQRNRLPEPQYPRPHSRLRHLGLQPLSLDKESARDNSSTLIRSNTRARHSIAAAAI